MDPERISLYRTSALRRLEEESTEMARRKESAWKSARRAARLLKEHFHATRVAIFGSLVRDGCFTRWSDVDIAAWGILPEETFRAIGAVLDSDKSFEINLVDVNACKPSLLEIIQREGVDL